MENRVGSSDSFCGTDGGATSQAGRRCPRAPAGGKGALSDAFRDVSVRNNVVNVQRELVQGAHKQANAMDQYLCQLRKAEGGLRGMNTAQAGDLVENLGQ